MLWLGVGLTTGIPCLEVSQNSLAGIVPNTPKYSHITPVKKTLHWLPKHCSIFKTVYFVLFLNLDRVFVIHQKAKLMVSSLRSHTLPLQYISLLSILSSALLMMLQRFGMICLMMFVQPLLSTHSERSSKSLCTSISTLISAFPGFSLWS